MPREIKVGYPINVKALPSLDIDQHSPDIEGCGRGGCGAWGQGVCRVTVEVPDLITHEDPVTYSSETHVTAVGCTSCGNLEGNDTYTGDLFKGSRNGRLPFTPQERPDEALLQEACGRVMSHAIGVVASQTQAEITPAKVYPE